MADLVLGLAKTTVEGTVTMARSAMEEEVKLQKTVQRDLLVISDEFEMMHSFLKDAKDRVTDNVTRTLVRQVRNTALDVEDCIEIIVHLDKKPHWWRRMMLPWCMPAAAPWEDLDAAVANLEQLKARVEAMGHRNLRYNRIGDPGCKPVEQMHQQAVANAMVPSISVTTADATKKKSSRMDLVTLINKKEEEDDDDDNKQEEKEEVTGNELKEDQKVDVHQLNIPNPVAAEEDDDDDKQEEKEVTGNELKEGSVPRFSQLLQLLLAANPLTYIMYKQRQWLPSSCREQEDQKVYVHQLKVISVLGTGSDLEIMTMKKAYDDSETCKNFTCRAWVKLVHPFNPIEASFR